MSWERDKGVYWFNKTCTSLICKTSISHSFMNHDITLVLQNPFEGVLRVSIPPEKVFGALGSRKTFCVMICGWPPAKTNNETNVLNILMATPTNKRITSKKKRWKRDGIHHDGNLRSFVVFFQPPWTISTSSGRSNSSSFFSRLKHVWEIMGESDKPYSAPVILLMAEIRRLPVDNVVYPIIYRVLYIPGGCLGFQPSTVPFQSGGMFLEHP